MMAEAERHVTATLMERVPEITDQWHRELVARLKVRPQAVFPGDELLDHMSLVVEHVIRLVETDSDVPEHTLAALHGVADHWRDGGYTIEESLLHFRVLNRVLHEELRSAIEAGEAALSGPQVARLAERLSHGSTLIQAVVVGSYRDREDERFAHYASILSHEIRGPLSSGLTALQMLEVLEQREPDEPGADREGARREALERLERSLWQVRDILDAVTTLVLPGSHTGDAERRRPLAEIVAALLAEFGEDEDSVLVEAEGEIPDLLVPYEPVLLVLHNLIQNGVSYSDPAKSQRWVRLRCEYDGGEDCWLLRVRDNGVGIPAKEQRLIFRRFRRGAGARGQGFGLGLSIVREAARRMKGDVTVESEPGTGSTFTFAFPVQEAQAR